MEVVRVEQHTPPSGLADSIASSFRHLGTMLLRAKLASKMCRAVTAVHLSPGEHNLLARTATCASSFSSSSSTSSSSLSSKQPAWTAQQASSSSSLEADAEEQPHNAMSVATVVSNTQVSPGLHRIMLELGSATAASYSKPGQYLQAKVAGEAKPGFFAIASAPHAMAASAATAWLPASAASASASPASASPASAASASATAAFTSSTASASATEAFAASAYAASASSACVTLAASACMASAASASATVTLAASACATSVACPSASALATAASAASACAASVASTSTSASAAAASAAWPSAVSVSASPPTAASASAAAACTASSSASSPLASAFTSPPSTWRCLPCLSPPSSKATFSSLPAAARPSLEAATAAAVEKAKADASAPAAAATATAAAAVEKAKADASDPAAATAAAVGKAKFDVSAPAGAAAATATPSPAAATAAEKATANASAPAAEAAAAAGVRRSHTVELLIKSHPGSSSADIAALAEGEALLVSRAQGNGFPLDRIPAEEVDTVLMFATGAGISPIKSVIDSGLLDIRRRKHVRLFYGTKSKESTAYQELVQGWEVAGVQVTQVFSGDGHMHVQAVLLAEIKAGLFPAGAEARVGALLCGQQGMCSAVIEVLLAAGVCKDRILLNY